MAHTPFQFTLRRMFVATAYVSVGFALAALLIRIFASSWDPLDWRDGLIVLFAPFAVMALLGAGVGELFGDAKAGAKNGVVVGVLLWIVVTLSFGVLMNALR
jgi:hypothetical protein